MANQIINAAFLSCAEDTGYPLSVPGTSSGTAVVVHVWGGSGSLDGLFADVVHLYATNIHSSAVDLYLSVHDNYSTPIKQEIPAGAGLVLVLPGLMIGDSKSVQAWASVADKIILFGHVDRIGTQ